MADCFAAQLSRRRGGLFLPLAYPADVADCFCPSLIPPTWWIALPLVYPAVAWQIAFLPFFCHFLLVLWTKKRPTILLLSFRVWICDFCLAVWGSWISPLARWNLDEANAATSAGTLFTMEVGSARNKRMPLPLADYRSVTGEAPLAQAERGSSRLF